MFHRVKTNEPKSLGDIKTERSDSAVVNTPSPKQPDVEKSAPLPSQTLKASKKTQSYLQVSNKTSSIKQTHQPEPLKKDIDMNSSSTPTESKPMTPTSANEATPKRPGASNYTPSYSSPYAKVTTAPLAQSDAENDRKLTIGRGITMSGEINSCDHLYVEGTVEAALKGAQMLDVSETGVYYGSVDIEEAVISGRFEGEMTVTGRLTIESTGIVTGTISYGEIQLEAGATIDGRMTPLQATPAAQAPQKQDTAQQAMQSAPAQDTQAPSQRQSGEAVLFEKQTVAKDMTAAE